MRAFIVFFIPYQEHLYHVPSSRTRASQAVTNATNCTAFCMSLMSHCEILMTRHLRRECIGIWTNNSVSTTEIPALTYRVDSVTRDGRAPYERVCKNGGSIILPWRVAWWADRRRTNTFNNKQKNRCLHFLQICVYICVSVFIYAWVDAYMRRNRTPCL